MFEYIQIYILHPISRHFTSLLHQLDPIAVVGIGTGNYASIERDEFNNNLNENQNKKNKVNVHFLISACITLLAFLLGILGLELESRGKVDLGGKLAQSPSIHLPTKWCRGICGKLWTPVPWSAP